MSENKNWPCTVYGLRELGGEIRYVGQTRWTLHNRLTRHYVEAEKGFQTPKNQWIRDVVSAGREVEIFTIELDAKWKEAERYWIAHYRMLVPDLLNVRSGHGFDKGVPRSEETRAKMAEASKRKWKDPEIREKNISAMKIAANTPESIKLRSDIQKEAWKREDVRNARLAKRGETVKTAEFREKMRESATKQMADPIMKERIAEKHRERMKDPAERQRAANNARAGWSDPDKRAARIEAMKRARWPKKDEPEIPGL